MPPNYAPTGRIFKEYAPIHNEPIVKPKPPSPPPTPLEPKPKVNLCCCGIVTVAALAAIGIANFVTYKQVPNQYNFVAGIIFCSLSGITLVAITIIGIKSIIKENQSTRPPEPSEPSDSLFIDSLA